MKEKWKRMGLKVVSGLMLTLLLVSMVVVVFDVPVVVASGTIYIRADGRVDPPTAPISSVDNVTYVLTGDINDGIVVERSNIIIDGAGYTIQGTGASKSRGIDLSERTNVTVQNTQIKNFTYGIVLSFSSNYNSMSGNDITNNWCGIMLEYSSSSNSISGNNITANNWYGIFFDSSSNNSISRNNITNNGHGISIYYSSNNSISGNNIANNDYGIWLESSSNNNIDGNNIANNWDPGIWLAISSNNNISGNNIANNYDGIVFYDSSNNGIYHNSFVDNTRQVYDCSWDHPYPPSINIWDDGYPSGGNYWSDYAGTDLFRGVYQNETGSDGIGDTEYIIDASNRDRYPLIDLWSPHDIAVLNMTPSKSVVGQGYSLNINVTVTNQGDYSETFNVTARADAVGISDGLVGYWSFDEGSGTTAHDSSGNYNDGTIYGANWTDGKFGNALSFDGIDDYISVPSSPSLNNISDAVTIAAWAKLEQVPTEAYEFIEARGYSYIAYAYVADPAGLRFNLGICTAPGVGDDLQQEFWKQYGATLPYLPYNQWYYVVWMYDSSGYAAIYVNGNSYANTTLMSGKICNFGWGLTINDDWKLHKGIVDEVRIYNRTLSQQEIRAFASSGAIQTQNIILSSGSSTTLTFTWNTTGFAKGNYTISAVAEQVLGETHLDDNNCTDGWILITKVGDLGGGVPPKFFKFDGLVDGKDLALFLMCFAGTATPPEANLLGDLGGGVPPRFFKYDGKVDGKDLSLFLMCFKGLGPPDP